MTESILLKKLCQLFKEVLPEEDARAKLSPLAFITGIIFCFLGDTKSFGLESIRRFLMSCFSVPISKGAFWERLAGNRMKTLLIGLLDHLIKKLPTMHTMSEGMLQQLGVTSIYSLDATQVSLPGGAKDSFPGTYADAGIKWHACIDLISGSMRWFKTTPATVHDRKCFPEIDSLKGKLILFDLGYWDYGLLSSIHSTGGRFLCRIKSNSILLIREVVGGIPQRYIGKKVSFLLSKEKTKSIIECFVEVVSDGESTTYRAIGFWNREGKKYHFYLTNLTVAAKIIAPLYRLRWQIELVFKSCKRSFNLDKRLTSSNNNIIETLILSSIVASFATYIVLHIGAKALTKKQRLALSFQRGAYVVVSLAHEFINCLVHSSRKYRRILLDKIKLLSSEIFEKNYNHRTTTRQRLENIKHDLLPSS